MAASRSVRARMRGMPASSSAIVTGAERPAICSSMLSEGMVRQRITAAPTSSTATTSIQKPVMSRRHQPDLRRRRGIYSGSMPAPRIISPQAAIWRTTNSPSSAGVEVPPSKPISAMRERYSGGRRCAAWRRPASR
jgi:hypothetical protein